MNKPEIIEKLIELGIDHDPLAKKGDLEALLPEVPENPSDTPEEPKAKDGIIVGNPLDLRPVELPLVVKSENGEWKNSAQAEYAKILNAYAYKNPDKWAIKKDVLIARLVEIGKNPAKLNLHSPADNISYKNKLIQ